jgi:putative membrane protein
LDIVTRKVIIIEMNLLKEILKGVLIGVANIIPGVSGGTMAVSTGVYDKMIKAITGFKGRLKESLWILFPYMLGAVLGIGLLSFVVRYTLNYFPLQTSGLFIGLIIGGLPVLLRRVKGARINVGHAVVFLVFFALVIGMTFLNGNETSASDISINTVTIIQLFLVGVIASATMIIPGVSGSLVMMILGFYGIIISNISQVIVAMFSFEWGGILHGMGVLLPFLLGVVVGIGLVAKMIEFLFEKVPVFTYFAIFGLVFGSPISITYKVGVPALSVVNVIVTLITLAIGFMITYLLGKEETEDAKNEKTRAYKALE